MSACFNHEDREGIVRCAVCGKSLCEECAVRENGAAFCSSECKEKASATWERSNDVIAEKAKTDSAALIRKLIYIFVVIAAIAAAYYFYAQREKSVERKFERSVEQLEKGSSQLLKDTKKIFD